MDLDFTPEQEMLRDAVAGVCARHSGPRRRRPEDDPIGYSDKFRWGGRSPSSACSA